MLSDRIVLWPNTLPATLNWVAKFILVSSRSVNSLIWALLFVAIFGPGAFGRAGQGLLAAGGAQLLVCGAVEGVGVWFSGNQV